MDLLRSGGNGILYFAHLYVSKKCSSSKLAVVQDVSDANLNRVINCIRPSNSTYFESSCFFFYSLFMCGASFNHHGVTK